MKIELGKKIGEAIPAIGAVKAWRGNPGDFTLACVAAQYYAKKHGVRMVVVPGNSYMHKVFSITKEDVDLKKFTVTAGESPVGVVYPNGDVFKGAAS